MKNVKVTRRLKEDLMEFVRNPNKIDDEAKQHLAAAGLIQGGSPTPDGQRIISEARAAIERSKGS